MKLVVCKDQNEANKVAGDMMVETVKENPEAILGLATGSTPVGMYNYMIEEHKENGTSYKNVSTVNLDEYIGLEPTHEQSYRHFMNETLFKGLDINLENTYVPSGMGDGEANAVAYEETLAELGPVDIQVLGIGTNGHIAFNEPGTSFDLGSHVTNLVPETIEANSRFFDSIDDVPKTAITMGIKSILRAKKIILLAFGENKAEAIKGTFEDEISTDLPATALRNHPDVTIITDEAAASLLTDK